MEANCQCGAVSFKTPLDKPMALYICHCAECRRQTSSAFGTSAIFPRFPLPDAELLSCYTRPTVSGQTLYCYFCKRCGTRLIHTTPNKNVVSVKGGCLEGLDWSRAIHIWTKSAMIPIPEGAESYSEESTQTSGYGESQETLDQPGMLAGSGGFPPNNDDNNDNSSYPGFPLGAEGGQGVPATKIVQGLCELSGMPTATMPGGARQATEQQQKAGMGTRLSSELEGWHP